MKKKLTIILVTASALMILDTLNAGHALVMFLLAGVIPGTNSVISASEMLNLFALLIGFTLSRVTTSLIRGSFAHKTPSFHASNGTILSAQS